MITVKSGVKHMQEREALYALLLRLHDDAITRVTQTTEALETLTRARRSENDDDEHDPEGVTLSSEWSRLAGTQDSAIVELQRISAALERWEAGTYGICAMCGTPIAEGRLQARPFAEHCVSCAEGLGL